MRYKINLLPKKELPFSERLVIFAQNYLRYIIILTQLVVIGVFFFRFQTDQKIIDLKEKVEEKKDIVQIVMPLLVQANDIDKKTSEIEKIIRDQDDFQQMLSYFTSIFPKSSRLTMMTITDGMIMAQGVSNDPKVLQSFYYLLKKENHFSTVELKNIKKVDNSYEFALVLTGYKK